MSDQKAREFAIELPTQLDNGLYSLVDNNSHIEWLTEQEIHNLLDAIMALPLYEEARIAWGYD